MTLSKNKQIKIGALISYASIAFSIISGILYIPWMIEEIGQSDYGIYTLANSIITLLMIDVGLGTATSRFVAKYRAENREHEIPGFLGAVYKIYLLIDALIFLVLVTVYFFSDLIYVNLTPAELEKFKTVFIITGVYSLISFPCMTFQGILTAYEKFIPLKLADLIQRVGTVLFTVIALLLGMKLYALVAVHAIVGLVAILVKFLAVHQSTRVAFVKTDPSQYKMILGFSIWSAIYGLAQRLIFNITPTILGATVTGATAAIAVFGIITTIEGYAYTFTTAINGMFLSKITRLLQGDDDGEKLTALAIRVGRFQYALNGLIVVGFAFVGQSFIDLWVGADYAPAYYGILLVLLPGLLFNSLQIFNTAIMAENLVKYQALIQIAVGICNVILSVIFSTLWGVLGASLSIFIAYLLRFLLNAWLIRRKLRVNWGAYVKQCYLKMSLPIVATGLVFVGLHLVWSIDSWLALVLKALSIIGIYLIFVWLLGLNKAERRSALTACGWRKV